MFFGGVVEKDNVSLAKGDKKGWRKTLKERG